MGSHRCDRLRPGIWVFLTVTHSEHVPSSQELETQYNSCLAASFGITNNKCAPIWSRFMRRQFQTTSEICHEASLLPIGTVELMRSIHTFHDRSISARTLGGHVEIRQGSEVACGDCFEFFAEKWQLRRSGSKAQLLRSHFAMPWKLLSVLEAEFAPSWFCFFAIWSQVAECMKALCFFESAASGTGCILTRSKLWAFHLRWKYIMLHLFSDAWTTCKAW